MQIIKTTEGYEVRDANNNMIDFTTNKVKAMEIAQGNSAVKAFNTITWRIY